MDPLTWVEPSISTYGPRAVRLTRRVWSTRMAIVIFTIAVLSIFGYLAFKDIDALARLATEGVAVKGRVVNLYTSAGRPPAYSIDYEFELNKVRIAGRQHVNYDQYFRTSIDDPFLITALPADPHIYRVGHANRERLNRAGWLWFIGGAAALLINGAMLLNLQYQIQTESRIARDFIAVPAVITGLGELATSRKKIAQNISYRYRPERGIERNDSIDVPVMIALRLKVGDPLTLMIDPDGKSAPRALLLLAMVEPEPGPQS